METLKEIFNGFAETFGETLAEESERPHVERFDVGEEFLKQLK